MGFNDVLLSFIMSNLISLARERFQHLPLPNYAPRNIPRSPLHRKTPQKSLMTSLLPPLRLPIIHLAPRGKFNHIQQPAIMCNSHKHVLISIKFFHCINACLCHRRICVPTSFHLCNFVKRIFLRSLGAFQRMEIRED